MTPQEKAVELYNKYEQLGKDFTRGVSMAEFAKQCALIAVNEIISTNTDISKYGSAFNKYWNEVKQELKNL
jgi:hypothetical protein